MTSPVEGLLGALRHVVACTARADCGGCEDCKDVARRALAEWDARPALLTDAAGLIAVRDAMQAENHKSWDWIAAAGVAALEAHLLGPRTPATPSVATETTGTTGGET